jgi:KaiC/GvpD/RAD55 family RecA-like ATPase
MLDRLPTGITGLDDLIGGGFPANTVNLVSAPTGGGKTVFAMQYLYNGVKDYGEPGVFITTEEGYDSIQQAMSGFGMDIKEYEGKGKLFLLDIAELRKERGHNESEREVMTFEALKDALRGILKYTRAKRLVLDSLVGIGLAYNYSTNLREEIFKFSWFLRDMKLTSLLTTESVEGSSGLTRYGIEQFISDSLIVLGLEENNGELVRTIRVRKMRFTGHDRGKHPFLLTSNGIEISPGERIF